MNAAQSRDYHGAHVFGCQRGLKGTQRLIWLLLIQLFHSCAITINWRLLSGVSWRNASISVWRSHGAPQALRENPQLVDRATLDRFQLRGLEVAQRHIEPYRSRSMTLAHSQQLVTIWDAIEFGAATLGARRISVG